MTRARDIADLAGAADAGTVAGQSLIINGCQSVAQRGTSKTGLTSGGNFLTDRFALSISSLGTWTMTQESDAPDGFANSLKIDCTTADASPAAGDYLLLYHRIEGQNLQHLNYGSSGAKSLTLSFWVKSNKTGTGSIGLLQSDNSYKMVSPTYTINSADTWEYKTINIPADASGVINDDNGRGFDLEFWLNSGSTYTSGTNQTSWTAFSNGNRNVSNLGIGGSTSDYWQITGVKLEVGSTATPFVHESYAENLAKCQRYYEQNTDTNAIFYCGDVTNTGYYYEPVYFLEQKRTTPTVTLSYTTANNGFPNNAPSLNNATASHFLVNNQCNSTTGAGYFRASYTLDAEL